MRTIEGYVCAARVNGPVALLILFGPNNEGSIQNILTNNFTAYKNKKATREGVKQLKQRKEFDSIKIAKLHMDIAEKIEEFELEQIKNSKSLAVIMINDSFPVVERELYGPRVEGMPGDHPLPGALLKYNGFKTFDSLKGAMYVAGEINRQAGCAVQITHFELKILEE